VLKKLLVGAGVLPSRFLWLNPFKIVEYEELLRGIDIRPADIILDLGCGGGPQDLLLARKAARVVGIDVAGAEIARARARAATYAPRRNVEFHCTPLEKAGFEPETFDKIVSFCVLEHIVNREEVLRVAARVLKPGGLLLLSVDSLATVTDPDLIAKHRADHAVVTYFTAPQLRAALEAHGFGGVRIWPIFRGPYAKRMFEAGIRREFRYRRYRKFASLVRLWASEFRHRRAEHGMFLCASAVKAL
jgi:SAM-dependent methyltransferase